MPSRRSAIAAFAAAAVGAACQPAPVRRRFHPTLDQFAERYVRLTLRLALHQPSLVEAWRGPEGWRPEVREPVEGIRQGIVEAHAAVGDLSELADTASGDRFRYLQGQLAALAIAARRLAGETMGFFAEASAALGLEPRDMRPDAADVATARETLERSRPGGGALHERYAAFRARHALAPNRIQPTFRAAVALCRDRVQAHIGLPETETVAIEAAEALDVEARASYDGGFQTRVALAASGPVDLAHLVWLAAHEAYPGHHVQHVLADRDCVRGRGWLERELLPNFGRHYFHAEGAAEAGAALLLEGDAFVGICGPLADAAGTPSESLIDIVAVHRAVVELDGVVSDVARAYLDSDIGGEAAVERLTMEALVPDARSLLSAIERQRTRMLAYPVGRRVVGAALVAGGGQDRWQRLAAIATTLCLPRH
jgi:hypothetical protein